MPWKIVQTGNLFKIHELTEDGSQGKKLKTFSTREAAEEHMTALSDRAVEEHMRSQYLFTELAGTITGGDSEKRIDGMAAGRFTTMRGVVVEFPESDLESYVGNTNEAISSTQDSAGKIVGLPIDENNHDHNGGAGWIVGADLDKKRKVVQLRVKWTGIGTRLIGDNIRRYFSPSIDTLNRVILGGSLTNWPATRLKNGKMILRPIELSQSLITPQEQVLKKELHMTKKVVTKETVADLEVEEEIIEDLAEDVNPSIKQLLQTPEAIAELGRLAEKRAAQLVDADKRTRHVVEFASHLVGGTSEQPIGLAVKADEIVAVLLSLPTAQSLAVENILSKMSKSIVDFAEVGYGNGGGPHRPKLSQPYHRLADNWVKAGKTIEEFFEVNPEIGELAEFDVSEFATEGEK